MDRDKIDEVMFLVLASALALPTIIHLSLWALSGAVR